MEIMPIGIELSTPPAHVAEVGSEKLSESSTSSASSIGCPSEDDEVESEIGGGLGSFGSLGDLEDSLPIKRGLSNYFKGKSRSFANLSDASNINDLEKQESPFNKRRRTLNACQLGRKSSFYTWYNPKSMPLLALNEEEDMEDITKVHERKFRNFKSSSSSSCFSLADMNEQHA